ncbi:MAG: GNAT family N-acetyltransferase, partial [Anaerolineae bacterium]|nr:GNAT family N-acetyltransferase [Anaerolineae bacterium]
ILVADLNGYPVGHLFIHFGAGNLIFADGHTRAYHYALRVLAPLRGYGIGTRLIAEGESMMQVRGFRWATIAVARDNLRARQLYERLGYRVFTDIPGHWSYVDPDGNTHHVHEPSWGLQKHLAHLPADES